jgi:hypothetical protein
LISLKIQNWSTLLPNQTSSSKEEASSIIGSEDNNILAEEDTDFT